MSEQRYIRIKNGLTGMGEFIPLSKRTEIEIPENGDMYESIYTYSEEQVMQARKRGSVAGITDVVTNKLYWDFDNAQDPSLAKKDTLQLVNRLIDAGFKTSEIQTYFSGKKGFTVLIETDQALNPNEVKNIAVNHFGKDLSTLDMQIYDHARVLRVPFSKHQDTKLRKIPLNLTDLTQWDINKIKNVAGNDESIYEMEFNHSKLNVKQFIESEPTKIKEVAQAPNTIGEIDWSLKPRNWLDYKWAIAQGFFEPGERHNALLILAATCRAMGYDSEQTYYLCKAALKKQAKRTGGDEFDKNELWENIIKDSVFSAKWNGGSYSVKNNIWLQNYCKKMGFNPEGEAEEEREKTYNISETFPLFKEYASNIDKLTVKFGVPELDKKVKLTIGMTAGIIAGPGVGKTSLIIQALNNMSNFGEQSIFFSFDMYGPIVVQKLLQKHTGLNDEQIFLKLNGYKVLYKDDIEAKELLKQKRKVLSETDMMYTFDFSDKKEEGFEEKCQNILKEEYNNVEFCFTNGMNIDGIVRTIKNVEEKTGKKVKFIAVDYNELISTDMSDSTSASNYVAQKLREIALLYNVCVIQLFQPNKMTGGPADDIKSYRSAKGGSGIEQSVGIMLGMSRPGYDPTQPENDKFARIKILKNRMGPLSTIDLHFQGLTGNFRSLTDEELNDLKQVEDAKKIEEDSDGGW